MISDINLALALDARKFNEDLKESRRGLGELTRVRDAGTGRFIKGTTGQLKVMEAQAKKTASAMNGGILGAMDRMSGRLSKIGLGMRVAGLGLGAAGGVSKLAGMWMTRGSGGKKPPPIPGTKEGDKFQARMARGKKLSGLGDSLLGMGGKVGMAGVATGLAGGVVGAAPAIARLLGISKASAGGVGQLTDQLGKLDSKAQAAGKSTGGLGGVLKGLGGATAGIIGGAVIGIGALTAGVTGLAASGLGMNAKLETAKAQFELFTGSATKADAIIADLSKRADVTPFETKDYIEGGTALMSAAQGSKDKLMELMKTAEMLTVLNPTEGLSGASVALKNALSGDFTSLQDRFNIAPSTIQKYKDMGLQGQALVRAVLQSMNVNEKSIDKLGTTFTARMSTMTSFGDNIRKSLSAGLFGWLSEKMGTAITWIDQNQQWVMDTASGLGMMIGQVFANMATWISGAWSTMMQFGSTLWEFFGNLPARISASFQDGTLMQGITGLLGSLMNVAWNTLVFLGKMLWDAIVTGTPLLVAIVGKMLVDGIRSAVGEKISGMLGLDAASQTLGDLSSGGASVISDKFKGNISQFITDQKAAFAETGSAGGKLMNTLGWSDAQKAAAAGGGPKMPGGISGIFQGAQMMGAQARMKKEAEIAQVQWGNGASPGGGGGLSDEQKRIAQMIQTMGPEKVGQAMANQIYGGQEKGMRKDLSRGVDQRRGSGGPIAQTGDRKRRMDIRVTSMDGTISPLSR